MAMDIPGAQEPEEYFVMVKKPNGEQHAVALLARPGYWPTIGELANAVEFQYSTIFPDWDVTAHPVQIYTAEWQDINDTSEAIDFERVYGVCPTNVEDSEHSDDDDLQFTMDP